MRLLTEVDLAHALRCRTFRELRALRKQPGFPQPTLMGKRGIEVWTSEEIQSWIKKQGGAGQPDQEPTTEDAYRLVGAIRW